MSWRKKVVWSEGMLLQPQHLQQHERHTDHVRHVTLSASTPYAWGFSALEIDTAALALGKLALLRATGVFADGTVFDMPAVDPLPDAVDIPDETWPHLQGLECWIVDALRWTTHPTHSHVDRTLTWIARSGVERAVLTNLHIDLDYNALSALLPANIEVGFDGWTATIPL